MSEFLFPLYAKEATASVTCTAVTQNIEVTARKITLNVASGVSAVATLDEVPAGVVFTLVAGTIAGGASIVVTYNNATTPSTLTFDTADQTVSLLSLGQNDFEILSTTDGAVFVDNTTS